MSPHSATAGDEARVLAAIEAGKGGLLERLSLFDRIEYRTGHEILFPQVAVGTVVSSHGATIRLKTREGKIIDIPRQQIVQWTAAGHIDPEMTSYFHGGPSALAALALLSAGVETNQPKMAALLDALSKDRDPQMGTYVHGLRASVWAAALERGVNQAARRKYAKLLHDDMKWLTEAPSPDGAYGYISYQPAGWWDHSNTQFANLGLWSGSVANIEVADRHWLNMARHWLQTQSPSGGWAYRDESDRPTPSMTVAGCNSLFIVLDRYYARIDGQYVPYVGSKPKPKLWQEMEKLYRAIERGDAFLRANPPNITQFQGYELFGLERLGLASGMARIGGLDWFREYVDRVADRSWGTDPVADSFALIFLVHGQAPVLIQKLEHGADPQEWNRYGRDMAGLCRYMSRTFERLYRWQRVPVDASLHELEDAPFLYISGHAALNLPPETLLRVRDFIDDGGTVFLHADQAGKTFTRSAVAVFERLFADRGFRFQTLEDDHPVFTCYFDRPQLRRPKPFSLQGMSDGSRIVVFLSPCDIAGAWQQQRQDKFEELFQVMANVRVYSAPPYGEMPSRLRSDPLTGRAAQPRGKLSLKRLPYDGDWNVHAAAWERYAKGLRHRTGIELTIEAKDAALDENSLRQFDLVHLTVQKDIRLAPTTLQALRGYLEGGGFLLIDAADGQPPGVAAVRPLVDELALGDRGILPAAHPIAAGKVPGGKPLMGLQTTPAGAGLSSAKEPPPMLTITINGRLSVIACPFDLIAGVDGHFIWNRSGYSAAATAAIVDNILSWRLEETTKRP